MKFGLDTSVVVRIVSGLPEDDARLVGERLSKDIFNGTVFSVSPLVLSEAYYALQHHYGFTKAEAISSLRAFVATRGIEGNPWLDDLLDMANLASAKPGFVDRMIVEEYAEEGLGTYSCEKAFARLPSATVVP